MFSEEEAAKNCVVGPVSVEPCPQASSGAPCRLKKGSISTLYFNFTPGTLPNSLILYLSPIIPSNPSVSKEQVEFTTLSTDMSLF
jgi:hypothetical protein